MDSIKLMTQLGWVIVGEEIEISIPKIGVNVCASNNGVKNQIITTEGVLLGHPFGYERTNTGRINLLYIVGLGKGSFISLKGERGLQCGSNILNSFCSKVFKQKGISARSVSRKDFKVDYSVASNCFSEDNNLIKRIGENNSVIFEDQQVAPNIQGTYWLASTSSRIKEGDLTFGMDALEDGVLKSEPLVDENNNPHEAKKQILALVKLKVDIEGSQKAK